jgi:mono/diheme cytochrome c family protein
MLSWRLLEVLMFRRTLAITTLGLLVTLPAVAQDLKAKGEKVFTDQKCSLCHSVAGKGNVKGVLDDVGSKLSEADIRAWITDANAMTAKTGAVRKPVMKQYSLPKDDVDALVAYVTTLKKK